MASSALHRIQGGEQYRRRATFQKTLLRNSCDQRAQD